MVSHDALVARAARLSPVDLAAPRPCWGATREPRCRLACARLREPGGRGWWSGCGARWGRSQADPHRGLAPLMAGLIPGVHAVDERLTLVGLRLIHELNAA